MSATINDDDRPTQSQTEIEDEENRTIVPLQRCPYLYLKTTAAKGRGVFSSQPLPASTLLDICPVLLLSQTENEEHIEHTSLYHYTYNWPASERSEPSDPSAARTRARRTSTSNQLTSPPPNPPPTPPSEAPQTQTQPFPPARPRPKPQSLILGLGSMFNHSSLHQNVGWTRSLASQTITYRTLRDVAAHEELCISYGSGRQLTFVDAEAEAVRAEELAEELREGEGGWLGGIEI